MYLYKTDVATLCALQPDRFTQLLSHNPCLASQHVKEATYGVVEQREGHIVSVLPVVVLNNVSTVLGTYTSYGSNKVDHRNSMRGMLELFIAELAGQTARVSVDVPIASDLDSMMAFYMQCGFGEESRSACQVHLSLQPM